MSLYRMKLDTFAHKKDSQCWRWNENCSHESTESMERSGKLNVALPYEWGPNKIIQCTQKPWIFFLISTFYVLFIHKFTFFNQIYLEKDVFLCHGDDCWFAVRRWVSFLVDNCIMVELIWPYKQIVWTKVQFVSPNVRNL